MDLNMNINKNAKGLHQVMGNAVYLPDKDTLHPLRFASTETRRIGQVFCESYWLKDKSPLPCARNVARQQVVKLEEMGYRVKSAFELEYLLLDKETLKPVSEGFDFITFQYLHRRSKVILDIVDSMYSAGAEVETIQTEASQGQFEFAMQPQFGLGGADAAAIGRQFTKEIADQNGLKASFMAKPFSTCKETSGWHFNHSLWDKKREVPLFHNVEDDLNLSSVAKYWIGGLMRHAPALSALCSPTVNDYRRFHRYDTPNDFFWDVDDRVATFRIKNETAGKFYFLF